MDRKPTARTVWLIKKIFRRAAVGNTNPWEITKFFCSIANGIQYTLMDTKCTLKYMTTTGTFDLWPEIIKQSQTTYTTFISTRLYARINFASLRYWGWPYLYWENLLSARKIPECTYSDFFTFAINTYENTDGKILPC